MKPLVRAHGLPLGSGVIRSSIEDFQVTEVFDFEPEGTGEHLLLWVEKRGANTGWVANQFASHFGLRHFDVSYCGKKDRHAVTRQWFSCYLPNGQMPGKDEIQIEGVEVLEVTRHLRKLRRGDHVGNRFHLVVRQLTNVDSIGLDARLGAIKQQGVPNYFGRQRFGRDGQNYQKACDLLSDPEARSRRKLDRKQKDIYLSALRSWLFNDLLVEEVKAGSWQDEQDLWVYGLAPHRDIVIPELEAEYQDAVEFIEGLGIKAHLRAKRVLPTEMSWQIEPDYLDVGFVLPVGAFATTVLEELLEVEDAQS